MNIGVQLVAGAVSYMVMAHYRGKPIHYIFKRSKENLETVLRLKKNVPQYSPTIYLPSSYMKTLSTNFMVKDPLYRRQILKVYGGGQVALDHYPRNERAEVSFSKKKPLVLIIPGFGTNSFNQYIYDTVKSVHRQLGWDVCVFNQKGTGRIEFTGDDILGYWNTRDLEIVLQNLAAEYDDIHLMGFSVGANLIQTYLTDIWDRKREVEKHQQWIPTMTEKRDEFRIQTIQELMKKHRFKSDRPYFRDVTDIKLVDKICSAVCISPIYRFQTTCDLISSKPWVDPILCRKFFAYVRYNMQFEEFRAIGAELGISVKSLKKLKNFTDMNRYILQGAMDEPDPQRAFDLISPCQHLNKMNTRMLCISSLDDPIVDNYHLPIQSAFTNENLMLALVTAGGHISCSHGLKNMNWSVIMGEQYMREQQELKRPGSAGPPIQLEKSLDARGLDHDASDWQSEYLAYIKKFTKIVRRDK